LVSLLQDPDQQLAIQVAVSLGSFAYGEFFVLKIAGQQE
jgi:hypothetical protein